MSVFLILLLISCPLILYNFQKELFFKNVYLVLAYCKEEIPLPEVDKVSKTYGITVDYAKCNLSASSIDACEGGIVLRWIISNWDKLQNGSISKVIFHHAHENSWHQKGLSKQLERLLLQYKYFCEIDFGEMYRHVIDHPITNGSSILHRIDFIQILKNLTKGTSFENINLSNSKNIWRTGQGSAFFVSSSLITRSRSISDYLKMLDNTHKTVEILKEIFNQTNNRIVTSNKYVAEVYERGWNALFANKTYIDYHLPEALGKVNYYYIDLPVRKWRGRFVN